MTGDTSSQVKASSANAKKNNFQILSSERDPLKHPQEKIKVSTE
jgi:hypothetical protein